MSSPVRTSSSPILFATLAGPGVPPSTDVDADGSVDGGSVSSGVSVAAEAAESDFAMPVDDGRGFHVHVSVIPVGQRPPRSIIHLSHLLYARVTRVAFESRGSLDVFHGSTSHSREGHRTHNPFNRFYLFRNPNSDPQGNWIPALWVLFKVLVRIYFCFLSFLSLFLWLFLLVVLLWYLPRAAHASCGPRDLVLCHHCLLRVARPSGPLHHSPYQWLFGYPSEVRVRHARAFFRRWYRHHRGSSGMSCFFVHFAYLFTDISMQNRAIDPIAEYTNQNSNTAGRHVEFADRDIFASSAEYILEMGEIMNDLDELRAMWNSWVSGEGEWAASEFVENIMDHL